MLHDIRKQYEFSVLTEKDVHSNPFEQFKLWLQAAIDSEESEPTAMVVSTVDSHWQPHSRVVLLKDFSENGLTFYTNYEGNKARQIAENNRVSMLFFWQTLERQVRITGKAEKLPEMCRLIISSRVRSTAGWELGLRRKAVLLKIMKSWTRGTIIIKNNSAKMYQNLPIGVDTWYVP